MQENIVFFKTAPPHLLLCDLKDAKVIRGGALSIKNATGYCFSKGRRGAYFSPTYRAYIWGGVLFITFVVNLYYI